jgi:hypothetical protein
MPVHASALVAMKRLTEGVGFQFKKSTEFAIEVVGEATLVVSEHKVTGRWIDGTGESSRK